MLLEVKKAMSWEWDWVAGRTRCGNDDDAVSIAGRGLLRGERMGGGGAHQAKECVAGEQCSGQTEDAKSYACVAQAASLFGDAEQASDARGERPAICGHGEGWRSAPFFHQRQRASIFGGIATDGERYIVTAIFPFGANAFAEPPDGRMVEE